MMRWIFFVIPLFFLPVASAHWCDTYTLQTGLEYLHQNSYPSNTSAAGYAWRAGLIHQKRLPKFGYTDRLFASWGILDGEDLFDEEVRIRYMELCGEFWLDFYYRCKYACFSPLIGYGIRHHRFKKILPFELLQEVNDFYIPIGISIECDYQENISLGARFKIEMTTYALWRYVHPVFGIKFYHLENNPAYEANAWLAWYKSERLALTFTGSFRTIDYCFSSDVPFAPESKRFYFFSAQIGGSFRY